MIPKYQTNLTPDEYENCVKHGAAMLMTSARQSGVIKTADNAVGSALGSLSSLGDYSTRLLLTLSVVTGVPAGIMLHTVGKRISERRQQDRQTGDEIGYYRNATRGLESEMARQGIKISQALDTVQMLKQQIMAAQRPQHKDNRQPEPKEPKTPIADDLRPGALEAASKQQEDTKKANLVKQAGRYDSTAKGLEKLLAHGVESTDALNPGYGYSLGGLAHHLDALKKVNPPKSSPAFLAAHELDDLDHEARLIPKDIAQVVRKRLSDIRAKRKINELENIISRNESFKPKDHAYSQWSKEQYPDTY